jgi:hypothetical protein
MRRLSQLLLAAQCLVLSTASPLYLEEHTETNGTLFKRDEWNLDELNNEFKGL